LYDSFRRGEVSTLVVSKVANFSIDRRKLLSRCRFRAHSAHARKRRKRLGRLLRPKATAAARFSFGGGPRQPGRRVRRAPTGVFSPEQGYGYVIRDADDYWGPPFNERS